MPQINQLPPVTTPASTDLCPVQQSADNITRAATAAQVVYGGLLSIPTSDPHVVGALFWNGTFLCQSQG